MNNISEIGKVSFSNKLIRLIWNIVYYTMFRPLPTKLFVKWRLFLLKLFGADVKKNSGVYASTKIWAPWNLKLGHNSWLGPNVICYNQALVQLDDGVTVSQYSYLCTAGHNITEINSEAKGLIVSPIILESGCWVGTRAYIGMGVVIGKYAIVGATASVYKDVDEFTVVGGNPAHVIKKRIIK